MAVVLRGLEWRKLLDLLEHCDWRWWFAGLAVSVLVQTLAAIRWAALARPITPAPGPFVASSGRSFAFAAAPGDRPPTPRR
jgi:uncharacterized membrane protein YbhN (UPF0104 family)